MEWACNVLIGCLLLSYKHVLYSELLIANKVPQETWKSDHGFIQATQP
jgi:hypothetical protein